MNTSELSTDNNQETNQETKQANPEKRHQVLNSALVIVTMTLVFGALSYALIQINNAVFQLSVSESLWCGLAMALATGFYLIQRARKQTDNKLKS
ncbi:hypothetical protein OS175_11000 [Marinicella sp. S1101]|uniref:hypothetical protein n=1 Tax=Marinicella marina TaxID=2996016 RepID=UPI002260FA9A|nr:hypothetical protein [Marinicella marina]MCX7554410.1 hypothetical protein [Marinicella marina]MDJ1140561.1 hypothetical protein [Marinicella marina]